MARPYQRPSGAKYLNTYVDFTGTHNLNRLARVLFDRTGLLLEIGASPELRLDEKDQQICIPIKHLYSQNTLNKDIDSILAFINQNKSETRIFATPGGRWIDSASKPVDLTRLRGQTVEVSVTPGNHNPIFAAAKVPFVGNMLQKVDGVDGYSTRFGAASENVERYIHQNIDVTHDKYSADQADDFQATMLIIDHITGKVGNYRVVTGTMEDRKAEIGRANAHVNEIAGRPRVPGKNVSIVFLNSSTRVNPVTPVNQRVVEELLLNWRREAGLSKIEPDDINTEMLSVWVNPDGPPVAFHRPLYIYTGDGDLNLNDAGPRPAF